MDIWGFWWHSGSYKMDYIPYVISFFLVISHFATSFGNRCTTLLLHLGTDAPPISKFLDIDHPMKYQQQKGVMAQIHTKRCHVSAQNSNEAKWDRVRNKYQALDFRSTQWNISKKKVSCSARNSGKAKWDRVRNKTSFGFLEHPMKYQQEKGVMFCPKFRQSEVGVRKKNKHWISGAPNEISATKRRCHALLKIPWKSWHFFCQSSPHFLTSTRQSILKLCFVNGHWSASKWLQTV